MPTSAPDEGPAGDPILLDAGRSCQPCADLGRAITRSNATLTESKAVEIPIARSGVFSPRQPGGDAFEFEQITTQRVYGGHRQGAFQLVDAGGHVPLDPR